MVVKCKIIKNGHPFRPTLYQIIFKYGETEGRCLPLNECSAEVCKKANEFCSNFLCTKESLRKCFSGKGATIQMFAYDSKSYNYVYSGLTGMPKDIAGKDIPSGVPMESALVTWTIAFFEIRTYCKIADFKAFVSRYNKNHSEDRIIIEE